MSNQLDPILQTLELSWDPNRSWDNYRGDLVIGGSAIEDAVHEISHFLIASLSERNQKNWGLGFAGNFSTESGGVTIYRDAMERKASSLGIHMLWKLGKKDLAFRTYEDHNWSNSFINPNQVKGYLNFMKSLRNAMTQIKETNIDHYLMINNLHV